MFFTKRFETKLFWLIELIESGHRELANHHLRGWRHYSKDIFTIKQLDRLLNANSDDEAFNILFEWLDDIFLSNMNKLLYASPIDYDRYYSWYFRRNR